MSVTSYLDNEIETSFEAKPKSTYELYVGKVKKWLLEKRSQLKRATLFESGEVVVIVVCQRNYTNDHRKGK